MSWIIEKMRERELNELSNREKKSDEKWTFIQKLAARAARYFVRVASKQYIYKVLYFCS
jgi:hypothetical protein